MGNFLMYLSTWIINGSKRMGPLFGFISEPYIFTVQRVFYILQAPFLRSFHFLDSPQAESSVSQFLMQSLMALNDTRIVLPHLREGQQHALLTCIANQRINLFLSKNEYCCEHLVPEIIRLSSTKDKAQISRQVGMLLSLFQGMLLFDSSEVLPGTDVFVKSFQDFAVSDHDTFFEMVNNIIGGINATVTNLYTSIDSVCFIPDYACILLIIMPLFACVFMCSDSTGSFQ